MDMSISLSQMIEGVLIAGAVYGAIRKDLQWLRRDVDLAHTRLDSHVRDSHNAPNCK